AEMGKVKCSFHRLDQRCGSNVAEYSSSNERRRPVCLASPSPAAQFCLTKKTNLDEALRWADLSIQNEERFENLSTKADILKALNRQDEAKKTWNQALEKAAAPQLYTYGRQLQNQKQGAEAMEIFKEVAKRFPQGVFGYLAQARIKSAAG